MRLAKATAIVVATLLGLATLWQLRGPVLMLLLSLVVAAAVRAPVDYLVGRGLPKSIALAVTYLVCLLIPTSILLAAVYMITGELGRVAEDFKRVHNYAARHMSSAPAIERIFNGQVPSSDAMLSRLVGQHGVLAIRLVLGTAFGVFGSVIDAGFIVVLSVYWTINGDYFERIWLALLPLPHRVSARKLWRTLEAELGAYVRSEIVQSLLAGVLLGLAFYVLGLAYPTLLALVAALSWLLPWFGAIIALAALAIAELPIVVFGWPGSLLVVATAALFTAGVFLVLELIVEPRMFNRRRYNSLFIVLAVMALAESFGILGLLMGPMVAVVFQVAVEHIERERVAARRPATDLTALDARMEDLRARVDSNGELSQEWTSIIDRLAVLMEQAREIFGESLERIEQLPDSFV